MRLELLDGYLVVEQLFRERLDCKLDL